MGKVEKEVKMKTCYFCKGKIKKSKIEHLYQWKGKRYLFQNVAAETCAQCGEVFLLPQSLKAIEKTIQHQKKVKKEIKIPVFSLSPAF